MTNETESQISDESEFLASNADFFANSFVPFNEIFQSSGPINIISEETKRTVVVGVKEADEDGAMDVDCVLLKPDQESLRGCINTVCPKN
jgi:hypothetical protein